MKAPARYDAEGRRLCKYPGCHAVVPTYYLKQHRYICSPCRSKVPSYQRIRAVSIANYEASAKGKERRRRHSARPETKARLKRNKKRDIYVGSRYHSRADTVEQAHAIRQHIQQRLHAFKGQQARTQAETVAAD